MAKQFLAFVALLVLQGIASSVAAPQSSGSTSFDEWFKTFDPSTAVASKAAFICTGKPNGFYPGEEPDICSASYTACVSGSPYAQTCSTGNVFDSTPAVEKCVDRYAAASAACEKYPTPACSANNVGVFEPIEKCSEIYYICLTATAQPTIQVCSPTTDYLNPVKRVCEPKAGADACAVPPPPPIVPIYGCSDKEVNKAYATSKCSVSFYTCDSTTAQPTPGSCSAIGAAGTVFDYKATPAAPGASLCVPRTSVDECTTSLLASV